MTRRAGGHADDWEAVPAGALELGDQISTDEEALTAIGTEGGDPASVDWTKVAEQAYELVDRAEMGARVALVLWRAGEKLTDLKLGWTFEVVRLKR